MRKLATILMVLSCAIAALGQSDLARQYATADIVFIGRLNQVERGAGQFATSFEIVTRVKGNLEKAETIAVLAPANDECAKLEERHSYLVYARGPITAAAVLSCGDIKHISLAEPDLQYIHTINSKISPRCTSEKFSRLARKSEIVATAEVVGTEETMPPASTDLSNMLVFRPWCGLVFTTEFAYYRVQSTLKGHIPSTDIAVANAVCWDTLTADLYTPQLSPSLFAPGNVLLLFLNAPHKYLSSDLKPAVGYETTYMNADENCGAVIADGNVTRVVSRALNERVPSAAPSQ